MISLDQAFQDIYERIFGPYLDRDGNIFIADLECDELEMELGLNGNSYNVKISSDGLRSRYPLRGDVHMKEILEGLANNKVTVHKTTKITHGSRHD